MAQRFGVAATLAAMLSVVMVSQSDAGWGWFSRSAGGYGSHGGGSWGGGSYGGGSWGGGSYGGGSWGGGSYGGGSWGGRSYGGSWGGGSWGGGSWGGGSWGGGSWGGGSWGGGYGSYGGGYSRGYVTSSYGSAGYYSGYGSGGSYGVSYSRVAYSPPAVVCGSAAPVVYESAPIVESSSYYPVEQAAYESAPVVSDDCCGGSTITGSYDSETSYESYTPVEEPQSVPSEDIQSPTPSMPEGDESTLDDKDETAMISVSVPEDAIVVVNGYRTSSKGSDRRFLSAGLRPGEQYSFEIRAIVNRDGKNLGSTRVVTLTAGRTANVQFDDLNRSQDSMLTMLKLHVPDDAKVVLAGQETSMSGSTRVFSTDRLESGKVWSDYSVQVTVVRDGREITRERTATIRSGEIHEMSFLVDEPMLAAR